MNQQKSSRRLSSGEGIAAHSKKKSIPALCPNCPPPGDPLLQQRYRELLRKHLTRVLDQLFAEFTGLHFHLAWTPTAPLQWEAETLPTACSVCCRLTGSPALPRCQECGPRQLAHALSAGCAGHRFTCRLGVRNYWLPIRVREQTLGIAYLQTLERPIAKTQENKRRSGAARGLQRPGAKVMSRSEFARASRLLELIVRHAQIASLADLREADLSSAKKAVLALEKEQVRLLKKVPKRLPSAPVTARYPRPESHGEQLVQQLLQRIEMEYGKPITLQQYARELGMNPAYLSDLFSSLVGVPFKTYVTELRLEKAKELFGDSNWNVSTVAALVGYSSANRFGLAFKKATGLPPRLWRETMHRICPPASHPLPAMMTGPTAASRS